MNGLIARRGQTIQTDRQTDGQTYRQTLRLKDYYYYLKCLFRQKTFTVYCMVHHCTRNIYIIKRKTVYQFRILKQGIHGSHNGRRKCEDSYHDIKIKKRQQNQIRKVIIVQLSPSTPRPSSKGNRLATAREQRIRKKV
jgi:hypothetical protein